MLSDSLPQVGRSTRAARRRGHEGLLPDRYRADGERCRARPRDATFDVLGFCGGIRASVSVLRSSRSALTRLRTRYEPSTDPFASVRYRPVTAVVLWRAGADWESAVDRKHLAPALLPARSTDWP